jgi:hypothetical protein
MKTILLIILFLFTSSSQIFSQTYFQKITSDPSVTTQNYNNISAWGDYDNDGDQDLVISSINDSCGDCPGPVLLFKNEGGNFIRVTDNLISQQEIVGSGIAWGDYDNDSYLDLFVCGTKNARNKLFHNEGNGNFTLVTNSVFSDELPTYSQAVSWSDYNKDGYPDIFVSNRFRSNFLYKNNGNGTFTKITAGSIVNDYSSSRGHAWGDYDNDGWQDLFVVNYEGLNDFLYHNNGNGTFTRILTGPMVNDGQWGASAAWMDYDNNGYLDLYVSNSTGNKLYYNNGNGVFTLNNSALSQNLNSYGFSWGDYNNDGLTDIFTVNAGQINSLYKNNGGSLFTKVSNEIVGQEGLWSVATNLIDYNNDGRLDLFVTNRFSNHFNYLYKNVSNNGNFITIRLRGCENKFGVGARIIVVANDMVQMKEVQSGSGWGSNSSLWSHFGLGNASSIDSIIIKWPSDSTAVYTNIPVNLNIRISECGPENVIGIKNNEISEAISYKLYQNFPNPFNPATVIKYEIPDNGFVTLKIYNVLGKEVASLVNEFKNSGNFQVQWDASGFSDGIYFYKLETGKFSETRKMMLLK